MSAAAFGEGSERPDEQLQLPGWEEELSTTAGALKELVIRDALECGVPDERAEYLGDLVARNFRRENVRRVATSGMVRLSTVAPVEVRWLWPRRIPLGRLTLIDGDPGLGKSTLVLDLIARVSTGAGMPDGSPGLGNPAGSVILTAEDGLADTVRPRLDAAGADPDRVLALRWVHTRDLEDGTPIRRLPTVQDLDQLTVAISEVGAKLLVVDPLSAYLGPDVNAHRDADVRAGLAGLAELAERLGVAVLAIRHLTKARSGSPLYAGGGSIALIAAARSAFLLALDPDDGERLILASLKNNLAPKPPSLALRVAQVPGATGTRIAWEGETEHDAGRLLEHEEREERTAREEAAEWLTGVLADGPRPAPEMKREAQALGIKERTLRRAREGAGVVVEPDRDSDGRVRGWIWRLKPGGHGGVATWEGGHLEGSQVAQGESGDSRGPGVHTRAYGRLDHLEAACADCGTPIEENPAFDVNRCSPCAIRAGKQDRVIS